MQRRETSHPVPTNTILHPNPDTAMLLFSLIRCVLCYMWMPWRTLPNLCTESCLAPIPHTDTAKEQDPQARWTKLQNLKPAAVQIIWAAHHYDMPSWPMSSGSCCILVQHCSWWFWRLVEWVPDSCMTVTSTPLHVHPHGLQQWGLEMKHVSNLILRSMAGVWGWD